MRNLRHNTRMGTPAGVGLLLMVMAACGAEDSTDSADDAAGGSGGSPGSVATSEVDGVGTVLVDGQGRVLYTSEQEADGEIRCVDDCLELWIPAEASGAESDFEGIGTVTREDTGAEQLTFDGVPLYAFQLDAEPGQVTGDNLSDSFGGEEFTWHAAVTEAAPGGGTTEEPDPGIYDY